MALALVARPAVQVDQVLHRALAEGGLADHQATTVVLDRTCEDLRRRRRAAVAQHRQRTVPRPAGVAIAPDADPADGFAPLPHPALVDEQTGERDRLVERTRPVAPQAHTHPLALPP